MTVNECRAEDQPPPRSSGLHRDLLRELASRLGGAWVTCAGRSMEPTIRLGDRVRVEANHPVRAGDVILFEGQRGFGLHRVVFGVPGTAWLVHIGDADSVTDAGMVHRDRVVGRACVPRQMPSAGALATGVCRAVRGAGSALQRALSPATSERRPR